MNPPPSDQRKRLSHEASLARRRRVCHRCGEEFLADFRHAQRKYCSIACSTQNRRKLSDAQLRGIQKAIARGDTFRAIAKRCGVTPQHIGYLAAKWRKNGA